MKHALPQLATLTCALLLGACADAPTVPSPSAIVPPQAAAPIKYGEISGARVFTESDVQNGTNSYPFAGANAVEAVGWWTFPGFTDAAFFLYDVGIVKLARPVVLPAGAYGVIPGLDQLDALKPSGSTTFTTVGYGLQFSNPAHVMAQRVRMTATPRLVQINTAFTGPASLLLSNNASTGGTCFGDSGGPNFLGTSNVIAAITSFAINPTCSGTGGVFRLDRAAVRAFIAETLTK